MNDDDDTTISEDYEDAFQALYSEDEAELRRARAYAMRALRQQIAQLEGTQRQIAARLGIKQPRLNLLMRGDAGGFSLDSIFRLAVRAGMRPHVSVAPTSGGTPAVAR